MKISRIREFKNFCLAATIFVAGASLAACSSSDDSINENQQPVTPIKPQVYTMTVKATKGSDAADTRGLYTSTTEGKTSLNVKWNEGEVVKVYQGDAEIGELTAAASATASTTLTGSFDSAPSTSAALTFYFHTNATPSYSGQDGTLETIASTYDFCAPATVTTGNFDVDDKNKKITVSGGVNFGTNQQAIIKFTLLNKANDATIRPSALTVSDGTSTVELTQIPAATYPTNGNGVLYVAFPAAGSAKTVTLTATVDQDTYTYEKSGVTFTNGNYYEINVKMLKTKSINAGPVEVPAGEHWLITGTVDGEGKSVVTSNRITIAEGAAVTLAGVNINGDGTVTSGDYAGIVCEGNATIILKGANTVKGFHYNYPGIQAGPALTTLTIDGTGTLNASSNIETENNTKEGSPGIGSGYKGISGNIIIQGSVNVTASGGAYAAGIGSGNEGTCGTITIKGGTIKATGGAYAAGIGSGGGGTCGNITITGRTITAIGGTYAPGIGSGYKGSCGAITIASTVSSVTATKGDGAPYSIGAGEQAVSCGTVKFDDRVMYDGSAWTTTPEHGNSYGGLKFAVSKTMYDGDTWTLTP